ncbi:MAG: hypothetical protein O8C58_04840, partial [Candidatus Methanoperedens sp.]|nr:hypothetical protein [Candidatus Methanoperedens sp.]
CGDTYRFVVVHSSSLDKRKLKTLNSKIEKKKLELYPLQIKWKFEKHGIFANASFSGVITKHSRYVYRKIEIIE